MHSACRGCIGRCWRRYPKPSGTEPVVRMQSGNGRRDNPAKRLLRSTQWADYTGKPLAQHMRIDLRRTYICVP